MKSYQTELTISTQVRGLHLITSQVSQALGESEVKTGWANLFIQHTSASLLIQENADPTAKLDIEAFYNRLVPDGQAWHQHTLEGEDDTTSHMKASLTQTSLTIPLTEGRLALGTWQGIYLFEHRIPGANRRVLLTALGA